MKFNLNFYRLYVLKFAFLMLHKSRISHRPGYSITNMRVLTLSLWSWISPHPQQPLLSSLSCLRCFSRTWNRVTWSPSDGFLSLSFKTCEAEPNCCMCWQYFHLPNTQPLVVFWGFQLQMEKKMKQRVFTLPYLEQTINSNGYIYK